MSKHQAKIVWKREGKNFDYKDFSRDHEWQFEGGIIVKASAAPNYYGNASLLDPEEAFVASLSSCHMLTFLAVASLKKIVLESYEDLAEGILEKREDGRLCITEVILSPTVKIKRDVELTEEIFQKMHEKAHKECFIANSVTTKITVKPILINTSS